MIVTSLPFTFQPPYAVDSYDKSVAVWTPAHDGRFFSRSATNSSLTTGRYGPEVQAGASFTASVTVNPDLTGTYECWLIVLGGTITTSTGNTLYLAGSTGLTGNGFGVNSTTIRVRASSTYVISTAIAPQPYEAFFVKMASGDFRVYQRGQKFTSTSAGSTSLITQGLGLSSSSITLAARWTNTTPTDSEIWELIANPWQVLEPQKIRIPVDIGAASGYTLAGDHGVYSITGQTSSVLHSKLLTADQGTYTYTGQDSVVLTSKVLPAEFGTYSVSGQAATLTYTPGGTNYVLVADKGDYTYTGQSATLKRDKLINALNGSYSITGQNATINYGSGAAITLKAGSWIRYRIIT